MGLIKSVLKKTASEIKKMKPEEKRQAIVNAGACDKVENVKLIGKNFQCKGAKKIKVASAPKPKVSQAGLAGKLGLSHKEALIIGRTSCNKETKALRSKGEVCVSKVFKPDPKAPRFTRIEYTADKKTKKERKAHVHYSIASILKQRIESAEGQAKLAGFKPMKRNLSIHVKINGVKTNKQIPVTVQSRSIYNTSNTARFKKFETPIKLGDIVGYKIGTPEEIYKGHPDKIKAVEGFISGESFMKQRQALKNAHKEYLKLPASDKVKQVKDKKGNILVKGTAKATWEKVSKNELEKINQ
jgi:hypothetical protein